MPAPSDEARGDAEQLAHLVSLVDRGELRVEIARRMQRVDLPVLHAEAAAGTLPSGKIIITTND
ncbi:hypothetical protein [Actinoplanes sp. URMC 104]|uniref:hypothetical protein n=1 Tax=Actinoplanes sp. URMC 104 TaxID=3423409 RepID=UPI003F1CC9B9